MSAIRSWRKRLGRWTRRLLCAYLAYALVFGIALYLLPAHPDHLPPAEQFWGKEESPDRAVLVEAPRDAFSRRVEIIRSARRTLDVCCHCVKTGQTSDCFFAELIRAADRGVRVRVLLDGTIGGLTGEHRDIALALRAHPNIEFRGYNPVRLLKAWQWNVRLHDKFILADDRMLMLGGRNIGDEYFDPPGYEGSVTHDRDVVVLNTAAGTPESRSSVTEQVRAYMECLWNAEETEAQPPLSPRKREEALAAQDRLRDLAVRWETDEPDYYTPAVPAEELAVPTRRITLLHNPVSDFKKEPVIGAALARLLADCRDVRIQTPYATANRYTLAALRKIADGARVELLTNSTASSPNLPAFSAYVTQRQKFLDTGIEIHEYQSRDSIHGKSCVADGHLSVVGSFNLDDRSMYIDTESVLVIDSPAFYQVLSAKLDELFARSAAVGEDNAYLPGETVVEPSGGKEFLMKAVSLFSRPLQFLI